MIYNIFHLNWILIDTVIIIFLILLLLIVKIYKHIARWRSDFTNENLSVRDYFLLKEGEREHKKIFKTIQLVKNKVSTNIDAPLLVILSKNKKKQLECALVEALATYGYLILHIVFKKHFQISNLSNEEKKSISLNITNGIEYLRAENNISNATYIIVDFFTRFFLLDALYANQFCQGTISINPPLDSGNIHLLEEHKSFQSGYRRLAFILSAYTIFFLKNNALNALLDFLRQKSKHDFPLVILDSACRSFKNYESLLLIKIIKIIDNYSLPKADVERKNSQKL